MEYIKKENMNQRSLDRLKGVKQVLIDILVAAAKDSPYHYEIPEDGGLRTPERQNFLFKKGVSKCDGYNKKSEHQTGKAYDIFLMIDGKASWDKKALRETQYHIRKVAKEKFNTELNLGCDWVSYPDYPHGQLTHI